MFYKRTTKRNPLRRIAVFLKYFEHPFYCMWCNGSGDVYQDYCDHNSVVDQDVFSCPECNGHGWRINWQNVKAAIYRGWVSTEYIYKPCEDPF